MASTAPTPGPVLDVRGLAAGDAPSFTPGMLDLTLTHGDAPPVCHVPFSAGSPCWRDVPRLTAPTRM